jgi:hypothetical protein
VVLEQSPLSPVSTILETFERKSGCLGLESREYGRRGCLNEVVKLFLKHPSYVCSITDTEVGAVTWAASAVRSWRVPYFHELSFRVLAGDGSCRPFQWCWARLTRLDADLLCDQKSIRSLYGVTDETLSRIMTCRGLVSSMPS